MTLFQGRGGGTERAVSRRFLGEGDGRSGVVKQVKPVCNFLPKSRSRSNVLNGRRSPIRHFAFPSVPFPFRSRTAGVVGIRVFGNEKERGTRSSSPSPPPSPFPLRTVGGGAVQNPRPPPPLSLFLFSSRPYHFRAMTAPGHLAPVEEHASIAHGTRMPKVSKLM